MALLIISFPALSASQQLSSARGVAMGAFTSVAGSIGSLDWNPAGLQGLGNWEINFTNFISGSNRSSGIGTFNSIGVGKQFFGGGSAALQYSPGKEIDFLLSSAFSIYDTAGNEVTAKYDQKISYRQNFSLGYSYQLSSGLSLGLGAHYFETRVSDMRYRFDETNSILSYTEEYAAQVWSFDLGMLTRLTEDWSGGMVLKNLFQFSESELPDKFDQYKLKLTKLLRAGLIYSGIEDFRIAVDSDSKYHFQAGAEWSPNSWLELRTGLYGAEWKSLEAMSIGFGVNYNPVKIDAAFISFPKRGNSTATASGDFIKSEYFTDIDYTPFTTNRFLLSATVNLWQPRATLARIEYVEMLGEVFTASHQVYAFRPVGKARVKNISGKTINAKVSFFVSDLMTSPTQTRSYPIAPDEVIEVPFYAVFTDLISSVKKFSIFDGTVFVNAEPASEYDDKYQTRVVVRGKNDWDGDPLSLRYFVTPNDPELIRFSREALSRSVDQADSLDVAMRNFTRGKILFNSFAAKMLYVGDPKSSKDYVQYPSETLTSHGGDCDDFTVFYASLLMSVGISVAFIDVVPPETPENSHIFLMFDSGISPEHAGLVSDNPKRYMLRKNESGKETVWIPVETTAVSGGFEEAWMSGASQYYENSELHLAVERGWMRIIDIPSGM